jgi:hypothetical protein
MRIDFHGYVCTASLNYQYPNKFMIMEHIPLLGTGKIDYQTAQKLAMEGEEKT